MEDEKKSGKRRESLGSYGALGAAVSAVILGFVYVAGYSRIQHLETGMGAPGLFSRDFYSVAAFGAEGWIISFLVLGVISTVVVLVFRGFWLALNFAVGPFAEDPFLKFPTIVDSVRRYPVVGMPIWIFMIYASASSGGFIIGKLQSAALMRNAPECMGCNTYEVAEGFVVGRPISGTSERVVLLRRDRTIVLLEWASVQSVTLGFTKKSDPN